MAASIGRQQALAAEATRDRALFERYAAHALDLADVEPVVMTTPSTPLAPMWPPKSRPAACISGSLTMR